MKKIILLLLLPAMLIVSCKGDDSSDNSINGNGQYEKHIEISEIVDYLPPELLTETKVVYKNETGGERELSTYYTMIVRDREEYERSYTHEMFAARLFDENDPRFLIQMLGLGIYSQTGKVQKTLDAFLMPGNESGSCSAWLTFENGVPNEHLHDDFYSEDYFQRTVTLNQRTFSNVYFGRNSGGFLPDAPYSEIAINSDVGVVAFRGSLNEWWVFDRFVE